MHRSVFPALCHSGTLGLMRRAATILIGIALGAIAAGIGVGIFLKLANDDRERLAKQLETTAAQAQAVRAENQRAIEEANKKLLDANAEVGKAQALIKNLEQERQLLATATPLSMPSTKLLRDWKDVVNIDWGVSLKYPADSALESNTAQGITLSRTASASDARWFSLMPYQERLETEILSSYTTSSPVSFLVSGHLMTGWKGTVAGSKEPIYALRMWSRGAATHLIWAREPSASSAIVPNVLSTMRFEK